MILWFVFNIVLFVVTPSSASVNELCAKDLRINSYFASESPRAEDLAAAYRHVLQFSDLSLEELRKISNAGSKSFIDFFKFPETGSVKRGQAQSALDQIWKQILELTDTAKLKEDLFVTLKEIMDSMEANASHRKDAEAEAGRKNLKPLIQTFSKEGGPSQLFSFEITEKSIFAQGQSNLLYRWRFDEPLKWTMIDSLFASYKPAYSKEVGLKRERRSLYLYTEATNSSPLPRITFEEEIDPQGYDISADGKIVVAISKGKMQVWKAGDGKKAPVLSTHYPWNHVEALKTRSKNSIIKILPDRKTVLIMQDKEFAEPSILWNLETNSPLEANLHDFYTPYVWAVSPSGKMVAVGKEKTVLYNLPDFTELSDIYRNNFFDIAISADGNWVATMNKNKELELWKTNPFSFVAKISAGIVPFVVQFLPDNKRIIVGDLQGSAKLIDLEWAIEEFAE